MLRYKAKGICTRLFLILVLVSLLLPPSLVQSQELDVTTAQNILNRLGYEAGQQDGVFGSETESAIRLFQHEHSIPITGLLDPTTVDLLDFRLQRLESKFETTSNNTKNVDEKINISTETQATTLATENPATSYKLKTIDWIIIALFFAFIIFILWSIYRILKWIKFHLSSLIKKTRKNKDGHRSKYDIKAEQIAAVDFQSTKSKQNKRKNRTRAKKKSSSPSVSEKSPVPNSIHQNETSDGRTENPSFVQNIPTAISAHSARKKNVEFIPDYDLGSNQDTNPPSVSNELQDSTTKNSTLSNVTSNKTKDKPLYNQKDPTKITAHQSTEQNIQQITANTKNNINTFKQPSIPSQLPDSNGSSSKQLNNDYNKKYEKPSYVQKSLHKITTNWRTESKKPWIPSDATVKVKGINLGGMIYVGAPPQDGAHGTPDNSFIDPSLSIGKLQNDWKGEDLPYWPNYSHLSTNARSTYLNWLSEGRNRVANPGYMFLYFYGLERRYFLDNPSAEECKEITKEVKRLHNLYCDSQSATKYLSIFIEATELEISANKPPPVNVGGGLPLTLKVGLARQIIDNGKISADWLRAWYFAHPDTRLRTPTKRCEPEFNELFKILFDKDHPDGMQVRQPKRKLAATYKAASGQFEVDLSSLIVGLPDVGSLRQPLNYAEKLTEKANDALNSFSRMLGKNADARETLLCHALLPLEIRHLFPCKEAVELEEWVRNHIEQGGLVDTLHLLERLSPDKQIKLTRKRLTDASDMLLRLGFGMAPDPRFALRGPKEGEPVILFELPIGTEELEVSDGFRFSSLRLGVANMMALSDNTLDPGEIDVINSIVNDADSLSDSERSRLSATAQWMRAVPPDMTMLRKRMKDAPEPIREAIAKLAIETVLADGNTSNDELKQLEKLYKTLGFDPSNIHSALHVSISNQSDEPVTMRPASVVEKGPLIPSQSNFKKSGIGLDLAKVERIDQNTREVSVLLNNIFSDEDIEGNGEDNAAVNLDADSIPGLTPALAALAKELTTHEHWSESDFEAAVSRHGLMPAGALEAINEWSFSTYNQAFLDEYNGYDVDPEIAIEIGD